MITRTIALTFALLASIPALSTTASATETTKRACSFETAPNGNTIVTCKVTTVKESK